MNAELMLLGFISLLLTVFQSRIEKLCISENLAKEWLPCKLRDASSSSSTTTHFQTLFTSFIPGRLLAEATTTPKEYCAKMEVLKNSLFLILELNRSQCFYPYYYFGYW